MTSPGSYSGQLELGLSGNLVEPSGELAGWQQHFKVVNRLGESYFEIKANPETGVIDMFAGPSTHHMAIFLTRAVELPDGRTAFTFTMFQGPGMSDELFDSQHE